jgi:hypothetical protein
MWHVGTRKCRYAITQVILTDQLKTPICAKYG